MKNIIKTGTVCAMIFFTGVLSAQARGDDDRKHESRNDRDRGQYQQTSSENRYDRRDNGWSDYRRDNDHDRGRGHDDRHDHGKGYGYNNHTGGVTVSIGRNNYVCNCGGGYWSSVNRRIWVPASFEWRIGSCGTRIRVVVPGYWKVVSGRSWVAGHQPTCRHH